MSKTITSASAIQPTLDQVFRLADQGVAGLEQLTQLNLQVVKALLAESAETSRAMLSATSADELLRLQLAPWQAAPEKMMAYGGHVQDIVTAWFDGHRAAVDTQLAAWQGQWLEAVNGGLRQLPGADASIAFVGSAVTAANQAYGDVHHAVQQVGEAIEAQREAVTSTARSVNGA